MVPLPVIRNPLAGMQNLLLRTHPAPQRIPFRRSASHKNLVLLKKLPTSSCFERARLGQGFRAFSEYI
jgi:hypothetical protein